MAVLVAAACADAKPLDRTLSQWSTSAPILSIGAIEGDSAYLFQGVSAARFVSDGRIVVADPGPSILRVFDDQGRFLVQMGREGDGPGEFRSILGLWVAPPDTLIVWDPRGARLTTFLADGSWIAGRSLMADESVPQGINPDMFLGRPSDGSVLLGALAAGPRERGQLGPDSLRVLRIGAGGEYRGDVVLLDGMVRMENGPTPFSPFPRFAVWGDSIYWMDGREPSVTVLDLAWKAGRTVTFPAAGFSRADAWAQLESELVRRNHWMLDRLADAPRSEPIPEIAGLLVDDSGYTWTKRFDPASDALWLDGGMEVRGGDWWVADPTGVVVAVATLPAGFKPMQIAGDRVLGVTADSLGVLRVTVHTILGARRGAARRGGA